MMANFVALALGARDDFVKNGPIVALLTAGALGLYGAMYGAGWVFLQIVAWSAG